jgi:predicted lipoprotein with Yx(FWY)xxD motif
MTSFDNTPTGYLRHLPNRMPVAVKLGLPLAAAAVLAAACSSGGGSGYGAAGAGYGGGGAASSTAAGTTGTAATVIGTASGTDGTFLTDGAGRAVYLWAADGSNVSKCAGGCAAAWPPVTVTGTATVAGSASAADIGTIARSDGSKQVTYHGHALYYYAGDSASGQVNGQGSDEFGAHWWLVDPTGTKITTGAMGGS